MSTLFLKIIYPGIKTEVLKHGYPCSSFSCGNDIGWGDCDRRPDDKLPTGRLLYSVDVASCDKSDPISAYIL